MASDNDIHGILNMLSILPPEFVGNMLLSSSPELLEAALKSLPPDRVNNIISKLPSDFCFNLLSKFSLAKALEVLYRLPSYIQDIIWGKLLDATEREGAPTAEGSSEGYYENEWIELLNKEEISHVNEFIQMLVDCGINPEAIDFHFPKGNKKKRHVLAFVALIWNFASISQQDLAASFREDIRKQSSRPYFADSLLATIAMAGTDRGAADATAAELKSRFGDTYPSSTTTTQLRTPTKQIAPIQAAVPISTEVDIKSHISTVISRQDDERLKLQAMTFGSITLAVDRVAFYSYEYRLDQPRDCVKRFFYDVVHRLRGIDQHWKQLVNRLRVQIRLGDLLPPEHVFCLLRLFWRAAGDDNVVGWLLLEHTNLGPCVSFWPCCDKQVTSLYAVQNLDPRHNYTEKECLGEFEIDQRPTIRVINLDDFVSSPGWVRASLTSHLSKVYRIPASEQNLLQFVLRFIVAIQEFGLNTCFKFVEELVQLFESEQVQQAAGRIFDTLSRKHEEGRE